MIGILPLQLVTEFRRPTDKDQRRCLVGKVFKDYCHPFPPLEPFPIPVSVWARFSGMKPMPEGVPKKGRNPKNGRLAATVGAAEKNVLPDGAVPRIPEVKDLGTKRTGFLCVNFT